MTRLDGLVLFNPSEAEVQRAIKTLIALHGDVAVVVDNSNDVKTRVRTAQTLAGTPIQLLGSRQENIGTAGALNLMLLKAREARCSFLHYLDQDSIIEPCYTEQLTHDIESFTPCGAIGAHFTAHDSRPNDLDADCHEVDFLISSGTAFSVEALVEVGGFSEQMFLDLVDHEICLRLRSRGNTLLVNPKRRIRHSIGSNGRMVGPFTVASHPEWRRELMWRNTLLLARQYLRDYPGTISRHLLSRIFETALTAWHLRAFMPLTAAARGIIQGLSTPVDRGAPYRPPGSTLSPSLGDVLGNIDTR